jgi:hypothetical protein
MLVWVARTTQSYEKLICKDGHHIYSPDIAYMLVADSVVVVTLCGECKRQDRLQGEQERIEARKR